MKNIKSIENTKTLAYTFSKVVNEFSAEKTTNVINVVNTCNIG